MKWFPTHWVKRFADAAAFADGFYSEKPDVLSRRGNNPGDLTEEGDVGFGTALSVGNGAAKITIYPQALNSLGTGLFPRGRIECREPSLDNVQWKAQSNRRFWRVRDQESPLDQRR
jgi:hypothetical protein